VGATGTIEAERAALEILGEVHGVDLDAVAAAVSAELGCPVRVRRQALAIDDLVEPGRGQADAGKVLARVRSLPRSERTIRRIAVVETDLHRPGIDWEFGEADLDGPAGLVSVHRLREESYGLPAAPGKLARRLTAEIVHEAAHAFGLPHCDRGDCVLSFAFDVGDVDERGTHLCPSCAWTVRRRVRREVAARPSRAAVRRVRLASAAAAVLVVALLPFLPWGGGTATAAPFVFRHAWHVERLGLGCADCHVACGEWTGLPEKEACASCHGGKPSGNPRLARVEQWLAEGGSEDDAPWCRATCRRPAEVAHHGTCVHRGQTACRQCHGDRCGIEDDHPLHPLARSCSACHRDERIRTFCVSCHR
jgi:archaemetzincin